MKNQISMITSNPIGAVVGGVAFYYGAKKMGNISNMYALLAIGAVGLEVINSYTSDGHEYQIVISSDVQETEWQSTVPSYQQDSTAENFSSIKIYHEVAGK